MKTGWIGCAIVASSVVAWTPQAHGQVQAQALGNQSMLLRTSSGDEMTLRLAANRVVSGGTGARTRGKWEIAKKYNSFASVGRRTFMSAGGLLPGRPSR